jgi:hypothetical protein
MKIAINPKLRAGFDNTPNEKRSKTELMRWWNNPFVLNMGDHFQVRCLDGGAWDRSTFYAIHYNLNDAIQHAKVIKETLSAYRVKKNDRGIS